MKFKLKWGDAGLSIDLKRLPEFQSASFFLKYLKVDLVLDIGSNGGQFIDEIREGGYAGDIVGFEPLSDEFRRLLDRYGSDRRVKIYPYALGNSSGTAQIHFDPKATNLASLSKVNDNFKDEWGDINSFSESVPLRKLDDIWDEAAGQSKNVFVKIDAQGNDHAVLEGSQSHFDRISGIQTELSIKPLYLDQKTILETIDFLREKGFYLRSLKPVSASKKCGELFEVDGIFLKSR